MLSSDIQKIALSTKYGMSDVKDIQNESGIYSVSPTVVNLPEKDYGIVCIMKRTTNDWIHVIFIPNNLNNIYIIFCNMTSGEANWSQWRKIVLS